MSLKNQIRGARDPHTFIKFAQAALKPGEDPHAITTDQFHLMTRMVFETASSSSGKALNALRNIATHPTQGVRLQMTFYQAVQDGLSAIQPHKGVRRQGWPEFFEELATALRTDTKLLKIVRAEVVERALPRLIWAVEKTSVHDLEVATGIIQALGSVPEALTTLEPQLVTALVDAQLAQIGTPLQAAEELMRLRATPVFASAIIAAENDRGEHIAAYTKTTSTPGAWYTPSHLIALQFKREPASVQAYEITYEGGHANPRLILGEDGVCVKLQAPVADALLEHVYAELPHQDWVKSIAEEAACRIG